MYNACTMLFYKGKILFHKGNVVCYSQCMHIISTSTESLLEEGKCILSVNYTVYYGTAQFKLDIYTRVIRQISCVLASYTRANH